MSYITKLSKEIEGASKTRLIKFLVYYFNESGIRNIVDYYTLGSLPEDESCEEEARVMLSVLNRTK